MKRRGLKYFDQSRSLSLVSLHIDRLLLLCLGIIPRRSLSKQINGPSVRIFLTALEEIVYRRRRRRPRRVKCSQVRCSLGG